MARSKQLDLGLMFLSISYTLMVAPRFERTNLLASSDKMYDFSDC